MATIDRTTTNFNFVLPAFDKRIYNQDVEGNFVSIDALIKTYIDQNNVQGIWINSNAVTVGQVWVDTEQGALFECLVAHTTAASPTLFAADRLANPTYWRDVTLIFRNLGVWATATEYTKGSFVVNEQQYAVANKDHTSGATFAGDSANWDILIDLSSITEIKSIVSVGSSKTLALTDASTLQKVTAASSITVPPSSSVAFTERTQIMIGRFTTGEVDIVAGSGVTIRSENSWLKLHQQYSPVGLLYLGTNEWWLTGSLKP